MKKLLIIAMLFAFAVTADAQWFDNFDSYANGQILDGTRDDGGWKGWDNDSLWAAPVTNAESLSAPHSVQIGGTADLVHEYSAMLAGQIIFTAWQYIPSDTQGLTYFILLNTYNDGGPYNWSTQLGFNLDTGLLNDEFAAEDENVPIVFDQWAEIRVDIDLIGDAQHVYYDGNWVSSKTWTRDGGSQLEIAAVDLFANGADNVYYDNMSCVPEPGMFLLGSLGLLALLRRRK